MNTDASEMVGRLHELYARATARPWRVFSSRYGSDVIAIMKGDSPGYDERGYLKRKWQEIISWPGFDACDVPKRYRRANAELIVETVNALPTLLTLIEQQESLIGEMRETMQRVSKWCCPVLCQNCSRNRDDLNALLSKLGGSHA